MTGFYMKCNIGMKWIKDLYYSLVTQTSMEENLILFGNLNFWLCCEWGWNENEVEYLVNHDVRATSAQNMKLTRILLT